MHWSSQLAPHRHSSRLPLPSPCALPSFVLGEEDIYLPVANITPGSWQDLSADHGEHKFKLGLPRVVRWHHLPLVGASEADVAMGLRGWG